MAEENKEETVVEQERRKEAIRQLLEECDCGVCFQCRSLQIALEYEDSGQTEFADHFLDPLT